MSDGAEVIARQQYLTAWGQPITDVRKVELNAWAEIQRRRACQSGPIEGTSSHHRPLLTGADVFWLAKRALVGDDGDLTMADTRLRMQDQLGRSAVELPDLHLEGAYLSGAHLEGATLSGAHLGGALLQQAHLEGAALNGAHLKRAILNQAHLEGAALNGAHLEGAVLSQAHLEGAVLSQAHLEGAVLTWAHLEGSVLHQTHLEGANLQMARLTMKTYLAHDGHHGVWKRLQEIIPSFPQRLPPTDLREAFFDASTSLKDLVLCAPTGNGVAPGPAPLVVDVHWNGANLSALDWAPFTQRGALLGDEQQAREWRMSCQNESTDRTYETRPEQLHVRDMRRDKRRQDGLTLWNSAVRANRQLASALRAEGMYEEANYFLHHAQIARRNALKLRHEWGQWFISSIRDLLVVDQTA